MGLDQYFYKEGDGTRSLAYQHNNFELHDYVQDKLCPFIGATTNGTVELDEDDLEELLDHLAAAIEGNDGGSKWFKHHNEKRHQELFDELTRIANNMKWDSQTLYYQAV